MATTIYNNIVSATSGAEGIAAPPTVPISRGPLGVSFLTPATPGIILHRVDLLLSGNPATNGTIKIELWSDNTYEDPDYPGYFLGGQLAQLVKLGSVSDTAHTAIATYSIFDFAATYPLAASTRYWIVATDISIIGHATSGRWAYSNDQTALGVAGEFFSNSGPFAPGNIYLYPNSAWPYQMRVDILP